MNWTICASSLQGKNHIASGFPCQDSNRHRTITTRLGEYNILVVSDGCGTATHSNIGAELITAEVADCLSFWLQNATTIPDLSELLLFSFGHAHQCLKKAAERLSVSINELAATCICLIIGPDRYAAAQIGDGIIVGIRNRISGCVFWPNQEYANVTHALTGREWPINTQTLNITSGTNIPDGWLLATDGIQAISCDYEKRVPVPGFAPALIDKLRLISNSSCKDAQSALEALLDSERVNAAVSDDKTIAVAFK